MPGARDAYARMILSDTVFARWFEGACVPAWSFRPVFHFRELFNVVHQTKQLPLAIHFRASTQREATQPFVAAQIRKHRLDGRKSLGVVPAPVGGVDALSHLLGVRDRDADAPASKRDVAHGRRVARHSPEHPRAWRPTITRSRQASR